MSIPDFGGVRTMWKHPNRLNAYFVTDEDRERGTLRYNVAWESIGGHGSTYDEPVYRDYLPSDVTFFPEPIPKRRR